MNSEELAFLADHVSTINGWRAERLAEVQDRIRAARRRRAAGAIAGTAALAAAVFAVAAVVPRSGDNSTHPIDKPTLPTVSPIPEPAGQTEITADLGPRDVAYGNVPIGSAVNEPGATELHANMPYYTNYGAMAGYCRGSEDIWWVANGNYGQCSPDAALEPTPPVEFQPLGNAPRPLPTPPSDQEFAVDMWLTGPLTAKARHCVVTGPDTYQTADCLQSNDVSLVTNADATFGFTAYVHSAPKAIHDPFGIGFEALANVGGTDYLFTRGVVSAPGAPTLAAYLDESEGSRLVLLVLRHPGRAMSMLVDDEPADFPTDLGPGSAWNWGRYEIAVRALVPPGSHNVTVDLPHGAQAAVLVYEAVQP